jgi:hypothetical protein
MKKKILNLKTVPPLTRTEGLTVSISCKSGVIAFSKPLGERLKLQEYRINFIQDEDRPMDWYLQVTKDPEGFQVRFRPNGKNTTGQFITQSTGVCRQLFDSCRLPYASQRFLVAPEPVEGDLFAIITKSAKDKSTPPAK